MGVADPLRHVSPSNLHKSDPIPPFQGDPEGEADPLSSLLVSSVYLDGTIPSSVYTTSLGTSHPRVLKPLSLSPLR